MDWIISMKAIITLCLLAVYGIFYMALGNLLVTSLFFGRISFMAVFGLIFVTIHMILMIMGVNKIGVKKRTANSPYIHTRKNVSSTHVDETVEDTCGFEHMVDVHSVRICPFCGSKVQFEDAVCPHCNHEI